MRIFNAILGFLFPSVCFLCQKETTPLCYKCAHLFPKAERPTEDWIYPTFDYRHKEVKRAIWILKYGRKKEIANILGNFLYESILEELDDLEKLHNFNDPIFIPIPLTRKREQERGFNQAEIILQAVLDRTDGKWKSANNILVKVKDTDNQARIKDKKTRMENMNGAFKVLREKDISRKNIILIDDVVTTGATLKEAKKVLQNAGAKKVFAFTLAH